MGGADYLDNRDRGWAKSLAGHGDTKAYLEKLADRLAVLISHEDSPQAAMTEIAEAAEHGGLIDNSNLPSKSCVPQFLNDLFLSNPLATGWLRERLDSMKPVEAWEEIADVAEQLL